MSLDILKKLTLLLIEDDKELKDGLSETLSIFFNKILTAENGIEALKILESNSIDMIITDYVMPLMDGEEFCRNIRNKNYKIPITIISNYYEKEKLIKLIDLELTNYVLKPVNYEDLIDCLKKMINKLEKLDFHDFQINKNIKYSFLTKELIDIENNITTKLTKSEVIFLELLLKNANTIIPIETTQLNLSLSEVKSEQAIKNIIYRLRKKIGRDTIQNLNNLGYFYKKFLK